MAKMDTRANDIMAQLQKKWYGYEGIKEEDEEADQPQELDLMQN